MSLRERISALHGLLVVATEEGCQVGTVEDVFVDPEARAIASLTVRLTESHEPRMLDAKAVRRLGRDVVFIDSEAAVEHLPEDGPLGRNVKELQGAWVTTSDGLHLGALVDLDVRGDVGWEIAELRLTGGKLLPIAPQQLSIGRDEIIVPAHCADMVAVTEPKKRGLLERLWGNARQMETEAVIGRVSRKIPDEALRPDSDMGI
jgi:uncharacterized protein YrrD